MLQQHQERLEQLSKKEGAFESRPPASNTSLNGHPMRRY
jgi:hypothetical protein